MKVLIDPVSVRNGDSLFSDAEAGQGVGAEFCPDVVFGGPPQLLNGQPGIKSVPGYCRGEIPEKPFDSPAVRRGDTVPETIEAVIRINGFEGF